MLDRRQFLSGAGLALAGSAALAVPGDRPAMDTRRLETIPDGSASRGMITPATDTAIQRGLEYLARVRERDGSWGTRGYRGNVAVTSLAGLAYMCGGHQPGRGRYGRLVTDALRFVMSKENVQGGQPGFLHNP